jgi:AraC family transcriptional regulator
MEAVMSEENSGNFPEVAACLVKAASSVRAGDCESAKQHIARALALMHSRNGEAAPTPRQPVRALQPAARSGLAAWQRRRISAHIDANLGAGIRIRDLAQLLGFSHSHFCRAFRLSFGIPPHLYVTRRRIEHAQTLMLTTPAKLSEIALTCGMSDQSHFTRAFRRVVGDTPDSWRRSRSSGN